MNNGLIIPILFLMALAGLIGYVTATAWAHRPARFFLLFLANLTLIVLLNPLRQLSGDPWAMLFFERLFYLSIGAFSLLMIWMLSQLFALEWWSARRRLAPILWVSAPYILIETLIAIDLIAQVGWFFGPPIVSPDDVAFVLIRPGGLALLVLLGLSYLPALGLLVASFARQPESRRPIAILFVGILLTGTFGFLNQFGVLRAEGGLLITVPILFALTYVVLQSRLVVPIDIALGQVLRQSADLIVVADRVGAVVYANQQAVAQGFVPGAALAPLLAAALDAPDPIRHQIAAVIAGEGLAGEPTELTVRAGERRLRLQLAAVRDARSYRRGALLVGRDITELEQRAEDLAARNSEQQRLLELVSTLETPSVTVADGVLLAPIVGALDSRRALALTDRLLRDVHTQRTRLVILDISGVPALDDAVAEALLSTANAVQLLGCRVVLSGISAAMAATLVAQGNALENLAIVRSPQDILAGGR
jgi:rsbT co-antagonist protein RsbR